MKTTSTFLKAIFMGCFCLVGNIAISQTRVADSSALVDLYNATTGASWTNKTNWLSAQPINTWFGVTLDATGRLSGLSLPNNKLSGGPIPAALAASNALVTLNLSNNTIGGNLPYFNSASLVTINLSKNGLFGTLNYYQLANLQTLDLSGNQLSGSIASLNGYANLVTLNVSNNQFDGGLPYFSNANLITLNLANNLLSGTINYYGIANIKTINFSNNQLTGAADALSSFSKAVTIDASYNQFSGNAPYLGGKDSLVTLNLSHNLFTGSLPYFTNVSLQTIDLSYNQFTNGIGYYSTPALVNFKVDHNKLTGNLNFYVPSTLKLFTANANKISGTIYTGLGGTTTLMLDSNKFTFSLAQTVAGYTANPLTYANQDTTLPLNYNTLFANKLTVLTAGGTTANNTYKWYKGATLVATIVGDSTYTPTSNGTYLVKITNSVATQLTLTSATYNLATLPVVLTSFTAQLNNATAQLKWQTSTEINNKYFDVERSADGIAFDKIGTVASLAVSGNSSLVNNYQFADNVAGVIGTIYYRLKQVDADGKFQYSANVSVNIQNQTNANFSVSTYPNPVISKLAIQINSTKTDAVSIKIISANGSVIYTANKVAIQQGSNNVMVDFGKYSAGIYTIQIVDAVNNTSLGTHKIVKY